MYIKKYLISIIIFTIFITGCDKNKISNVNIASEATKQTTITKVQNDINEIMNKDYTYLLENIGISDISRYQLNYEDLKTFEDFDEFNKENNIEFIYIKDDLNVDNEESALFIEVKNNNVINVETNIFNNDVKQHVNDEFDFVVNKYNKNKDISRYSLEEFKVGEDIKNLRYEDNIIVDLYHKDSKNNIQIYKVNTEEVFVVYSQEDIIYKSDLLKIDKSIQSLF